MSPRNVRLCAFREHFGSLYGTFVDRIVAKASVAALNKHLVLAKMAVDETGRGLVEDKATKNIFACEHVTNYMAGQKTVGIRSCTSGLHHARPACRGVTYRVSHTTIYRKVARLSASASVAVDEAMVGLCSGLVMVLSLADAHTFAKSVFKTLARFETFVREFAKSSRVGCARMVCML